MCVMGLLVFVLAPFGFLYAGDWKRDGATGLEMRMEKVAVNGGEENEHRLEIRTARGVMHVVESSEDMVHWSEVGRVYGFGQEVFVPMVRTKTGGAADPDAGTELAEASYPQPAWAAFVHMVRLAESAGGGIVATWRSLEGEGMCGMHVAGVTMPDDRGMNFTLGEWNEIQVGYNGGEPLAVLPSMPVPAGMDAEVAARIKADFPAWAASVDEYEEIAEPVHYEMAEGERKFFRVRTVTGLDSDGDGLADDAELAGGSNPFNPDSDGDGIDDARERELGTDPTKHAAVSDSDGDGLMDNEDAVPGDGEINWRRTPEYRYVWVEEVVMDGDMSNREASAVSRHGHILFPGSRNASTNILWDSEASSWVSLVESNTWSGSGLLQENKNEVEDPQTGEVHYEFTYDPVVVDAPYHAIYSMNDEGAVVGISQDIYSGSEDGYRNIFALMKWERHIVNNDYQSPTYLLASTTYDGYYDSFHEAPRKRLREELAIQSFWYSSVPKIADDGTISATGLGRDLAMVWLGYNAGLGQHCNEMTEWLRIDLKAAALLAPEKVGAILDNQTALLIDTFGGEDWGHALQYKNAAGVESLEGLLDFEAFDSDPHIDMSRTPVNTNSMGGRVWFSLDHDDGENVFIEKRIVASGLARWHRPPSMGEGAIKLNARGEAITRTKLWRNGEYTELNEITSKAETVTITKAIDLASNGIILAEADDNGVRKTGLLLPVEVRDEKKVADRDDDVVIETIPPKAVNESDNDYLQRQLEGSQIAYIEPHGAVNNTDPEMPHLVARINGGPANLKVRWKMLVEYKRGNGYRASYVNDFTRPEDTVKIPADGGYTPEMGADNEWRIFESQDWQDELTNNGFFGGTAKLYMWLPSLGSEPTEPFMTFRIGGKNPDQTKAKTFIDARAGAIYWYAYAIAKHETFGRIRENGQIRFYNQFYTDYQPAGGRIGDNANDMGWVAWAKGWPLYNLDRSYKRSRGYRQNGPGGYGMFQLTLGPKTPGGDQSSEAFITRSQIWNWQENCIRAIEELQDKSGFATNLENALEGHYTGWPQVDAASYGKLNGREAMVLTYYNGMYGGELKGIKVGKRKILSCWRPIQNGKNNRTWIFLQNRNKYVQHVNSHIE